MRPLRPLRSLLLRLLLTCALLPALASAAGRRPDLRNCTFLYVDQPLDHFSGQPGPSPPAFKQRVCVYDAFARAAPPRRPLVLFYAGNEGPVDLYVNNTGIMWALGRKFGAVLVFAEHRYFGESVPQLLHTRNCLRFLTSTQALADYALLVPELWKRFGHSQLVAFGGSYGGMLAAWFRLKYPHLCQAAIAGSAPILGYASSGPPLDGAFRAISTAAEDAQGQPWPQCHDSFLAAWVLLDFLMKQATDEQARRKLSAMLGLCGDPPLAQSPWLIQRLQDVLFLLAEGNFAFPSDYIVFSITNTRGFPLPAWPMRRACERITQPEDTLSLAGSRRDVDFSVRLRLGDGANLGLAAKWDVTSCTEGCNAPPGTLLDDSVVRTLIGGIRDVYGMIYNVTGGTKCFDLFSQDALGAARRAPRPPAAVRQRPPQPAHLRAQTEDPDSCTIQTIDPLDAWGAIVCNEGLALVSDVVRGVGNDFYWPPTVPRELLSPGRYDDAVLAARRLEFCASYDGRGMRGVTSAPAALDPLGRWAYAVYQGRDLQASKIAFSNGRYDPWSAAGVNETQGSLVSIKLYRGGHHADFMFPSPDDTPDVREARVREEELLRSWLGLEPAGAQAAAAQESF